MSGMTARFTLEQIRQFWEKQAVEYGESTSASWSDRSVIEMEIREILKYLDDRDRILDAGCANGYSTVQFASQKEIIITGIDYVSTMIESAKQRVQPIEGRLKGSVD